jgi:tetratricopeptide (TPR) repeat protein
VVSLVARWEEQQQQGQTISPEELCQDCPELLSQVRQRIGAMQELDFFLRSERGGGAATQPETGPAHWPRVPGYEILAELGKGGMGVVYKARHEQLGHLVAVKMILAGAHARDRDVVRFLAEAGAVAHLQHANIVRLHEFGQYQGLPFFTLEFMPGGSLAGKLQQEPLLPREAARIVEQLAHGMFHAHQAGIIHRDLKPHNVLLASDGTPKITDFGLVKRVESGDELTHTGDVMGTPSYMAPEQARGDTKHVGPAADIYALGAILYECLTGRPPFKGPSTWDTLTQVMSQDPVPPSRLQPKVPRDLETICLKCLHKEPQRRYPSSSALAEDLRRWQAGEPITARPVGLLERGVKWVRRRPTLARAYLAIGIAVLAMLAGGAFFLYREHKVQLDEAARHGEQQARLESTTKEVGNLYEDAQQLVQQNEKEGKEDWQPASEKLAKALGLIGDEVALDALKHKVEQLQTDIGKRQQFAQLCQQFTQLSEEAEYLANFLPEGNPATRAAHAQATQQVAAKALAIFGVSAADPGPPHFGSVPVSAQTRQQLTSSCYELVLILAEAAVYEQGGPKAGLPKALFLLDRAADMGGKTKAYHLRRERYLKSLGDKAGADKERQLAKQTPAQTALDYLLVGDEARRSSDLASLMLARHAFEQALELNPKLFWAHYLLANNYMLDGQSAAAVAHLTTCISLKPEFPWPYVLRGTARATQEEFTEAAADFAQAENLEKAHPDKLARYGIYVSRGFAYVQQGKGCEKLAKQFQKKGRPNQAAVEIKLAQVHYAAAVAEFTHARDLDPKSYQAYVNLAGVHQRQAALLHDQQSAAVAALDKKALHMLDTAIALKDKDHKPDDAGLYRTRAKLLIKLKQPAAALKDLDEAIRLGENANDAKNVAGDLIEKSQLLYQSQQFAQALTVLTAALTLDPEQLQAYQLRGKVLLELKRYAEAEAAFDVYLENGGKPQATLYLARGLARAKQDYYDGALRDFTEALELDRLGHLGVSGWHPDPEVLRYRGWAYLIFQAPKLALKDFDQALTINPNDADALNGRGFALAKLGQWQKALADAEQAVKLGTPDARLYYNAARTVALVAGYATGKTKAATDEQKFVLQSRALGLLKQALALVPAEDRAQFWKTYIATDAALESIRQTDVFAKLAAAHKAAP